jgi:hypothetical protein
MGERVTMTAAMLAIALGVAATIKASNPPAAAAVAQPTAASTGEVATQNGSNSDWIKH